MLRFVSRRAFTKREKGKNNDCVIEPGGFVYKNEIKIIIMQSNDIENAQMLQIKSAHTQKRTFDQFH